MRQLVRIAAIGGALALSVPALAAATPQGDPPRGNGKGHGPGHPHSGKGAPGPKAGLPAHAKAYGRRCKGESHKHVKGEKGTPFSQCVRQMKQAAKHEHMAPGRVCKEESRKHVKGEKGTPFSQCVHRVNAQRRAEKREKRRKARKARRR